MDSENYQEYLDFAIELASEAKEIMLSYFYGDVESHYKSDETIVTRADTEINHLLITKVKEKYPNHSVDGEEEKYGNGNYKWICDPVDGTAMYARKIPTATFSLALVNDGNPIVGVALDPFTDSLYTAIKGKGAYLNHQRIYVSDIGFSNMESVSHFDMMQHTPYKLEDVLKELSDKTYFVSIGSIVRAALCVASGEFNLAIFPGVHKKYCDIAAVKLIVEEAGGIVTDLFGNNQRYDKDINGAIISNKMVYEETLKVIKKFLENKKFTEQ
ncbi:MAG: hypothetical protein HFE81_03895 [Bacilli bacterium]|nr:hypothetical protein [Bacilli bacterium]